MNRSVEVAPRGRRPPIRLRPVPPFEPPFEDEVAPTVWASAHQLSLDWSGLVPHPTADGRTHVGATGRDARDRTTGVAAGTSEAGAPDAHASGTRTGRTAGSATGATAASGTAASGTAADAWRAGEARAGASPADTRKAGVAGGASTGRAAGGVAGRSPAAEGSAAGRLVEGSAATGAVAGASGDAKLAVRRFVGVCVEVMNGYRPAAHLRRLSLPGEAAGVVAQAVAAARRVSEMRRTARGVRPSDRHGRRPDPVAVLRLRLCEPRPGAVEAAVLLVTGERTWALAIRLERHQQAWAATALRVV